MTAKPKKENGILSMLAVKIKENKKLQIAACALLIGMGALILSAESFGTDAGVRSSYEDNSRDIERQLEDTLSFIEGVGRVRSMITYSQSGEVEGVIVIAEGTEDITTRMTLQDAVKTVLNIDLEKVAIFEMKKTDMEDLS